MSLLGWRGLSEWVSNIISSAPQSFLYSPFKIPSCRTYPVDIAPCIPAVCHWFQLEGSSRESVISLMGSQTSVMQEDQELHRHTCTPVSISDKWFFNTFSSYCDFAFWKKTFHLNSPPSGVLKWCGGEWGLSPLLLKAVADSSYREYSCSPVTSSEVFMPWTTTTLSLSFPRSNLSSFSSSLCRFPRDLRALWGPNLLM